MQPAPIFATTDDALRIAYAAEGATGLRSPTALAIGALMLQRYGLPPVAPGDRRADMRGLSARERLAQCALVRAAVVHHLDQLGACAIWARYGHAATRRAGVWGLREALAVHCQHASRDCALALIWGLYCADRTGRRGRWSLRSIAAEYGSSRSSLQRDQQQLRDHCLRAECGAVDRLDARFRRSGLVSEFESLGQFA